MNTRPTTPSTPWELYFQRLAARALDQQTATRLLQNYHSLFTAEYQALVSPRYALQDLLHLEQINTSDCQAVSLLRPCQHIEHYRLHFYSQQERYLDEYIPLLENLGLRVMDQVQFRVTAAPIELFIKSFTIKAANIQYAAFPILRKRILASLDAVMADKVENDALNKLTLFSGLAWQEVDLLRAYRNYYLQLGHHTSKASVHHALINNPQVSRLLFNYFETRFRPNSDGDDLRLREEQTLLPLRLQLLESISLVSDINHDRILRTLFNLIDATMRSNFHLRRTLSDYFIAFKINSLGVIEMPNPKPQNEIYVHAADMEGIHLRGGKISRGGIRWSDRPDDFRTEILGLMQTQISKNALIIPTGAKGGFIVKKNGSASDFKEAGKKAYIRLIRGLLDLTDNYHHSVAKLEHIVAYDDPDPYLVVAADKGTAQFSDIANGVAAEYRFWLDDAFASGGSHGYDHKALGITARGAWECIKRHFHELGKDIQHEPFTVIGIGSMDGDVFGNGMLLSPCIRLLAAFSGQHIFIDPDPADADAAFQERKRLFELPGSSWNDYSSKLISAGGGIYLRSDKDIALSPQVKKWLGIRYKSLDGESLIRYLLTAQIDLLWLGGIGTYVKASTEKHEDVGDKNNDYVRVNANDLSALVVGEGANLGFTQKARIEYALRGGRINTDAIDNSAGVDTSDHEVNLKILLRGLHKNGLIADYQSLFTELTPNVCALVLANNQLQSLCLSLEQKRCKNNPVQLLQLADRLEASGFLDKTVESFPPHKDVLARPGQNLTRPELAVLIAASKMHLTQQIQQSAWLQETCWDYYLQAYFPEPITAQFCKQLSAHPLASDIKATLISNKIMNQAGCGFLNLGADNEHSGLLDAVACYLTFDRAIDGNALRQSVYALGNKTAADKQYRVLIQIEEILLHFCRWALAHNKKIYPDTETINYYSRHVNDYCTYFNQFIMPSVKQQLVIYQQDGFPSELAQKILTISSLLDFQLIISISEDTGQNLIGILKLYNEAIQYLGINVIIEQLTKISTHDPWEQKVLADMQENIRDSVCVIINNIVADKFDSSIDYFEWRMEKYKLQQYKSIHQEISNTLPISLIPYIALTNELKKLATQQATPA